VPTTGFAARATGFVDDVPTGFCHGAGALLPDMGVRASTTNATINMLRIRYLPLIRRLQRT
jgi:hypothetical protein